MSPRWVGSGWTIFNNKGQPVRQYEPFFSATHGFEFARIEGVSPVLCYDPPGRIVATLHPNHTWEKVVFNAGGRRPGTSTTRSLTDPLGDPDVAEHFRRLPGGAVPAQLARPAGVRRRTGALEQAAAAQAADHAGHAERQPTWTRSAARS